MREEQSHPFRGPGERVGSALRRRGPVDAAPENVQAPNAARLLCQLKSQQGRTTWDVGGQAAGYFLRRQRLRDAFLHIETIGEDAVKAIRDDPRPPQESRRGVDVGSVQRAVSPREDADAMTTVEIAERASDCPRLRTDD